MATAHDTIDPLDPVKGRAPLILGNASFADITNAVAAPLEQTSYKGWWLGFGAAVLTLGVLLISVGYLVWEGTGIWGLQNPVGWGWAIVNFVFWVGIGHAGTLISAILFLFRQKWRTSINRYAEAMTIFAVICALLFPTIHVGRIWLLYWVFPIPNQMAMWPNFMSPLLWDVFAVSTYFTVSLLFWYVGLIPDFATMRDRSKGLRQKIYGGFALGWRGSMRHWVNYEKAYLILAALSTPLVLSVHTIVSFDFAVSNLPGWHTTIFPPYFVAGAIFGGFAMVLLLLIPARELYPNMKDFITLRHLENMAKIILVTGMMVGFAYSMEFFIAWYSTNDYELYAFKNRAGGPYWWAYWTMISCNVLSPQVFWIKFCRQSPVVIFIVAMLVTIGMWFERFVIIVTSLHRAFLPAQWGMFFPTAVDIGIFVGSLGIFTTLFLLFMRFLPVFAMAELKAVMPQADPHLPADHSAGKGRH